LSQNVEFPTQLDHATEASKLAILLAMVSEVQELDIRINPDEGFDFQGCDDSLQPVFIFMRYQKRSLANVVVDSSSQPPHRSHKNFTSFLPCLSHLRSDKTQDSRSQQEHSWFERIGTIDPA
jgi:hypothetical protein